MKHIRLKQSRLFLVIVVVLAAFLAAFLGQLLVTQLSSTPSFISTQPFVINSSAREAELLRSGAQLIQESEASSFVEFYQQTTQGLLSVGEGVVLTNDGWLGAIASESGSMDNVTHVRLSSGAILEVSEMHKDPASDFLLVHADSQSLNSATLARQENLETFSRVLCSTGKGLMRPCTYLSSNVLSRPQYSSDEFSRFITVEGGKQGDRVYGLNGEMIGIIFAESEGISYLIDSMRMREVLDQVLRNGSIRRPSLGLNYLDLSLVPILEAPSSGALVAALSGVESSLPVFDEQSPALAAGIRLQDVIVSVDGDLVNHRISLFDLILNKDPGDTVELGLLRQGRPITVLVTLNESASGSSASLK